MQTTETVERLAVATRDVVRAHEAIRDTFAGHRLIIRGSQENFSYRQATAFAGELAVDSLHHTMGVREDVDPIHNTWMALVTDGGLSVTHAGGETRSTPGDVVLFPQGVPFTCEWQLMDLHVVRVPTREIVRRAAAEAGSDPADFSFDSLTPNSAAAVRYCRQTMAFLHSLFVGDDPMIAEPLLRSAALDTAAAAVLAAFPNTATTSPPTGPTGQATPAAVRRTIEFIDTHADEPLTLADIVAASRIGPRALQAAFRRHRDTTPTAYLRRVRLERAHQELRTADPTAGATVAAVAARWGFLHAGRFAAAYRRAYGRTPQQTLLS
jgi:AraC-like DNA-binding protein